MLDKLKKHYKDAITTDLSQTSGFQWFITNEGEAFGITQSSLSDTEKKLLSSMFDSFEVGSAEQTFSPAQLKWKSILTGDASTEAKSFHRFVHFFSKKPITDYSSFSEAVNGLFPEDAVLLLNHDFKSGVIIETSRQAFNDTPYEALKDVLSTDFYMDISIYIGSYHYQTAFAKDTFEREQKQFLAVKNNLLPKSVYTTADIVPYLLLRSASEGTEMTLDLLFDEWAEEDQETLKSIKVFVECNMNISLAAKKLYIHRNSLQYRVDKFYDKTGIDVKQFKNAITVYMAILYLEQKNRIL
ncbi:helix-turn-helix domain-containing protein [Fictibacillus nanhaiensis]|uniref:PucR family transcriptional regulator n=1 Tax=Fictibacillus nanhaiensis TaxID=742169 RepID=UPI001C97FFAF|nr:helix-turn-helix domain-containing protein [Fictibacillus nanhaiensis]MBY6038000.1 helix-turn-helix domain-containing protein [Fictibacillus nanhaiensis]